MLSFREPTAETIREFLAGQAKLDFTYESVGATATVPPVGYVIDHKRIKLGEGEAVYLRAKLALKRWKQFDLGWVEAWPPQTPILPGEVVAVVARQFAVWWLNACRIVYVIDEAEPMPRFGFAHGTLPDHLGAGEERFLVEWDRESGAVWYDILAFSRPHQWLARLGYLYMRRVQKRFGKESAAAMARAMTPGVSLIKSE